MHDEQLMRDAMQFELSAYRPQVGLSVFSQDCGGRVFTNTVMMNTKQRAMNTNCILYTNAVFPSLGRPQRLEGRC